MDTNENIDRHEDTDGDEIVTINDDQQPEQENNMETNESIDRDQISDKCENINSEEMFDEDLHEFIGDPLLGKKFF